MDASTVLELGSHSPNGTNLEGALFLPYPPRPGSPAALNRFKSFPDLEETEYLALHRPAGAIRGVQVKCPIVRDADTQGAIAFGGRCFVPSPLTDFVVLARRRDRGAFDNNAWLIPAADIPHLVRTDWPTSHIELRISITRGSRFDEYRLSREAIATTIEQRMPP